MGPMGSIAAARPRPTTKIVPTMTMNTIININMPASSDEIGKPLSSAGQDTVNGDRIGPGLAGAV